MSLWKRIKTLWYMSALELPKTTTLKTPSVGISTLLPKIKKNQMAKIIETDFLDTLDV